MFSFKIFILPPLGLCRPGWLNNWPLHPFSHAPALWLLFLPRGESHRYPLTRRLGGPHTRSLSFWKDKNRFPWQDPDRDANEVSSFVQFVAWPVCPHVSDSGCVIIPAQGDGANNGLVVCVCACARARVGGGEGWSWFALNIFSGDGDHRLWKTRDKFHPTKIRTGI
jgi:hypothetical protein